MSDTKISLQDIHTKWQQRRAEKNCFHTSDDPSKPKCYVLDMFPYPSGSGMHVGHFKGYIATDVIARKKMLEGFNVLHPMGWDAFGLPAEQYAIKNQINPRQATAENVARYKAQLHMVGPSYDWEREVNTTDPHFYKRTQRTFIQLYNHWYDHQAQKARPLSELKIPEGLNDTEKNKFLDSQRLAFIDFKPINWCPVDKTILANEDLENGRCERCGSEIERRPMKQRVIRITDYADRLLSGLDTLPEWTDAIKEAQKNRIGRSEGTQFTLRHPSTSSGGQVQSDTGGQGQSNKGVDVFTTRIDTVFGMSFVVIAPEHEMVSDLTTDENKKNVEDYCEQAKKKTDLQRMSLEKEKSGVFTGSYVINPFNNEKIPVFVADYVIGGYGTGAVMGVPAHDERDFDFAKKYDLAVKYVVSPLEGDVTKRRLQEPGLGEVGSGILINSGEFSGMSSNEAKTAMNQRLEKNKYGGKKVQYRLQDWVFSRQRYWGEPFPVIYDDQGTIEILSEDELPLILPDVENYQPTGTEEGPLGAISERVNITKDGKHYRRETNTMPQWAGSSRYWLRYMDPRNEKMLVDPAKEKYRGQVDYYVGGAEHATRHLIYARFWHKFLFDIGVVSTQEPFKRLQNVGLVIAEDHKKMSKRRGNVINPDDIIAEFGADALRVYEMFMGPFDQEIAWSTQSVKGVYRFLEKVVAIKDYITEEKTFAGYQDVQYQLHVTLKKISEDIEAMRFNTAISQMMIFVNAVHETQKITISQYKDFIVALSPFAPHLSEELRNQLGESSMIFDHKGQSIWPQFDPAFLQASTMEFPIQINGKTRGSLKVAPGITQEELLKLAQADEGLKKYFQDQEGRALGTSIKKIIFVKDKIMNVII